MDLLRRCSAFVLLLVLFLFALSLSLSLSKGRFEYNLWRAEGDFRV